METLVIFSIMVFSATAIEVFKHYFIKTPLLGWETALISITYTSTIATFISFFLLNSRNNLYIKALHEISERKKTQIELEKSEEKYRILAEAANDAIFVVNKNFKFNYLNKKAASDFNKKPNQLIGKALEELFGDDQAKILIKNFDHVFVTKKSMYQENFIKLPNREVWVGTWLVPIKDKNNNVTSVLGVSRDISNLKRIEKEISQRLRIESVLSNVASNLVQSTDTKEALNISLKQLGKLTEATRSFLFLFRDNNKKMDETNEWASGETPRQINSLQDIDTNIYPEITSKILNNETIVIKDTSKAPLKLKHEVNILAANSKSFIIIPLQFADTVFGFIGFEDASRTRKWTNINPLLSAAYNIASFLYLKKTERKRSQAAKRLNQVLETTDEGIYGVDTKGKCFLINKAASELTGYNPEEVIGNNIHTLMHHSKNDGSKYPVNECPIVHSLREGRGIKKDDEFFWRKDRSFFPVEYSSYPIIEEGIIKGAVVTFNDISERKELQKTVSYKATHDVLTNLPNRNLFKDQLISHLAEANRYEETISIMFVDLDHFKKVNDTLGHNIGDRLLKKVSIRLKDTLRKSEIIARIGGDEFLILIPKVEDVIYLGTVAARILDSLRKPFYIEEKEIDITTSIGISIYPGDGDNSAELISNADTAMYAAKQDGRDKFQYFNDLNEERKRSLLQRERKAA